MEMKTSSRQQPDKNDPLEQQIRDRLQSLHDTEWSKEFFENAKKHQIDFLKKSLNEDGSDVRGNYLKLLEKLSEDGNAKITEGLDHLSEVKDKSFIIVTNHIGTAKISRINLSELNIDNANQDEIEPFPIRIAPLYAISSRLDASIHECATELPQPFAKIQEESGVVTIPATGTGKAELLQNEIDDILLENGSHHIFVMYPEGGTSGKRNSGGPYDLDNFHTGAFVIAKKIGLPILPVFQSFNPKNGFELKIIKPILSSDIDELNFKEIVEKTKMEMQRLAPQ